MKCIIPKHSGFCFGVSLAVDAAYENADGNTYMYGEVVHNPIIVEDLQKKGLPLISNLDDIPQKSNVKVLIRAHGVSERVVNEIEEHGFLAVDKTCPKVKSIHKVVFDASSRGLDIIVVGTPNHPEIEGIIGWTKTKTILLHDIEDAYRIIPNETFSSKGICMVSQTTHNKKKYEEIYKYCVSMLPNIEFHNTVCNATSDRQDEVRDLAKTVDGVIVVGGKTSSNVTKLYEIASEYCKQTQHIESAKELNTSKLVDVSAIVIVGGASTPASSVSETIDAVSTWCASQQLPFEELHMK